jgi:prepilin-type N-terminal cleavage/methylation domain-containing protein
VRIKVRNLLKKKDQGFTLIEIVLVLAIAGLIMVIVFLAVSGAQKSRRDTQRKQDANAFAAALEQYASNNGGSYPAGATIAAGGAAPTGASYWSRNDPSTGTGYAWTATPATAPASGTIAYNTTFLCAGQVGASQGATQTRKYAVVIGLEQGGSYCVDDH